NLSERKGVVAVGIETVLDFLDDIVEVVVCGERWPGTRKPGGGFALYAGEQWVHAIGIPKRARRIVGERVKVVLLVSSKRLRRQGELGRIARYPAPERRVVIACAVVGKIALVELLAVEPLPYVSCAAVDDEGPAIGRVVDPACVPARI